MNIYFFFFFYKNFHCLNYLNNTNLIFNKKENFKIYKEKDILNVNRILMLSFEDLKILNERLNLIDLNLDEKDIIFDYKINLLEICYSNKIENLINYLFKNKFFFYFCKNHYFYFFIFIIFFFLQLILNLILIFRSLEIINFHYIQKQYFIHIFCCFFYVLYYILFFYFFISTLFMFNDINTYISIYILLSLFFFLFFFFKYLFFFEEKNISYSLNIFDFFSKIYSYIIDLFDYDIDFIFLVFFLNDIFSLFYYINNTYYFFTFAKKKVFLKFFKKNIEIDENNIYFHI